MKRPPRIFIMSTPGDLELAQHSARQLLRLCAASDRARQHFERGALGARSEDVKALLRRRAEECKAGCAELMAHVRRLGGRPADAAPAAAPGLAEAAGMPQPAVGAGETGLLADCEAAEAQLLAVCDQLLEAPLEPAARVALELQRLELRRQHALLVAMRERLARLG